MSVFILLRTGEAMPIVSALVVIGLTYQAARQTVLRCIPAMQVNAGDCLGHWRIRRSKKNGDRLPGPRRQLQGVARQNVAR